MIQGVTTGAGGGALGRHLADVKGQNDYVRPGASRGLVGETTEDRIRELTQLAAASRAKKPIAHFHADPPADAGWGEQEWASHWERLEKEFGLDRQPFDEEVHGKNGREHRHRVYSLYDEKTGRTLRLDHSYARLEKLSRLAEFETGQSFVPGRHNRAVVHSLRQDGRADVAMAIEQNGLTDGPRPSARVTPQERHQEDRTRVSKADVSRATAHAWTTSDDGQSLVHALRDAGLILARGDKVPVILDQSGNTHSLSRMLAMAARADGEPSPRAADVQSRLAGIELPSLDEARAQVAQVQPVHDSVPVITPDPLPPGGGQPVMAEIGNVTISQGAPSQDVTLSATPSNDGQPIPTAASAKPASGQKGGGGGSSPSSSHEQSSPLPSLDVGRGPGEPPGPGAHPDEIARHAAAVAGYQERKEKSWLAFIRAFEAQNKPKSSKGASGGGSDNGIDEKALRERASEIIREIEDGIERGITLKAFYAAWDTFRNDQTPTSGLDTGPTGTPSPDPDSSRSGKPGERHVGEDDPAHGQGGAIRDARDGGSHRPHLEEGDSHRSALERAAERTRIESSASVLDMSSLRMAMMGPDPLEGLEGKDRKEKLTELNSALHAEFRASQRQDFSEALARERMRSHPLAKVLRERGKHLPPDERAQAWADIKAAHASMILKLKEQQKANSKAAFRQFVECMSHVDSKAAAVWNEMKAVQERNQKIASELARADEKIAHLRASEPQGERDPEKAAKAVCKELHEPMWRAQEKLKSAQEMFEQTPVPQGWSFFNPWAHSRFNQAKKALDVACADVAASTPHHMKIAFEESKARSAARSAAAWDAGPGKELRALVHGVQSIRDALENRDYRTRDTLVSGGLEAALELIRKREADEQRKREIEAAKAAKQGNIYGFPDRQNQQGMEMPAPRMR